MAATVADWITYAAARGDTVSNDADSAAALVRAQDYILHQYVSRFRSGYDVNSPYVDEATYEAANLELATPGFWTKTYTPDQQKVLTKVGDIQWTVRGDASGALGATPVSTKIDGMLRRYLRLPIGAYAV